MKKYLILTILALGVALAHADTMTFLSTGSNAADGYYTYPYYFSINGSATATPLMCLSFDRHITQGETWTADAFTPASIQELEATWLLNDAQKNPANASIDNVAAWMLFSNNVPADAGASAQLALALLGYIGITPGDFVLYVPVAGFNPADPPQIFLGNTPEPMSLLLLGSGILGLAVGVKRKGGEAHK